jgi:hypothetical protein
MKSNPTPQASHAPASHVGLKSESDDRRQTRARIKVRLIAAAILLGLSAAGMLITDVRPSYARYYWIAMVFVFGFVCFGVAWWTDADRSSVRWAALRLQLYHWGGLLIAMNIMFGYAAIGNLSAQNAGLVAVLMLALGTYLAGVHSDGTFMLIGALLGAFSLVGAYAQDHMILWTVVICVIAVGILFVRFKFFRQPT